MNRIQKNQKLVVFSLVALFAFVSSSTLGEQQTSVTMELSSLLKAGGSGEFNVSQDSGNPAVGSGSVYETYSGHTKYLLKSGSGRFDGFSNAVRKGLSFGPFQTFQSFLTANFLTVVSSSSFCPAAGNYNWMLTRARSVDAPRGPMNATSSTFYPAGTVSFDPAASPVFDGTGLYRLSNFSSVSSPDYDLAEFSGSCSGGQMKVANSGANNPLDTYGTFYFGPKTFLFVSSQGNPLVAIGSEVQTLTTGILDTLGAATFSGFYTTYDNSTAQTNLDVYIQKTGSSTTPSFDIYTADDLNDPTAKTLYATMACGSLNDPSNGFLECTLTKTSGGTQGNALCMLSTLTAEPIVSCTFQKPGSNTTAGTLFGRVPRSSTLALVVTNPTTSVAPGGGTQTINVEAINLSGREITSMGRPAASELQLAAPFSDTGAFTAANSGECGTTLAAYSSCNIVVTYNPSAIGTHVASIRVAYDSGAGGTVNAKAQLVGSRGLVSVDVTPHVADFNTGTSVQFTTTATYSNATTQNISAVVQWTSSNSALAEVGSTGFVSFLGSSASSSISGSFQGVTDSQTFSITGKPELSVLGQVDANTSRQSVSGMWQPSEVAVSKNRLIVGDKRRVAIWNKFPTASHRPIDIVLGQSSPGTPLPWDFSDGATDPTDSNFGTVSGVATDGTRLAVADFEYGRVLIWNRFPMLSNQPADLVLGQTDFVNRSLSSVPTARTFLQPGGVLFQSNRLFVVDSGHKRVLIWNSLPSVNGQAADVVLGQPNMTSYTSADPMEGPSHIASDGTRLYVLDLTRILVWNTLPTSNGQAADLVLSFESGVNGHIYATSQYLYATGTNGLNRWTLPITNSSQAASLVTELPGFGYGIGGEGSKIAIANKDFGAVRIFSSLPTSSNTPIDVTLERNALTETGANTIQPAYNGQSVHGDSSRLFVADPQRFRILVWNSYPATGMQNADLVLNQPNFTAGGFETARTLQQPRAVYSDGTRLYASFGGDLYIWNTIPTVNNAAPDVHVANNLFSANGIAVYGGKLLVSIPSGIFIWNSIPTQDDTAADVVLGTPAEAGFSPIRFKEISGIVVTSDGALYAADGYNHRVVSWNSIPTVSETPIDHVRGQPSFYENSPNNGGISGFSFYHPSSITYDGTYIFVADKYNHRVIGWNASGPLETEPAAFVFGQTSVYEAQRSKPWALSYLFPAVVFASGSRVFSASLSQERLLVHPLDAKLVIQEAPDYTFFDTISGTTRYATFSVFNVGGSAATSVGAGTPALGEPFGFKGGSYPGTGGTCGSTIAPQVACTIVVRFSPVDASLAMDDLRINYTAVGGERTAAVRLKGSGSNQAVISISDPTYDFGSVSPGSSSEKTFTLSNSTGVTALNLRPTSSIVAPFSFKGGAYPGTGGTCGTSLSAGSSCTAVVRYAPVVVGNSSSSLSFAYYDGATTQAVSSAVTAKTPSALSLSSSTVAFGIKAIGSTTEATLTVTNGGGGTASSMVGGPLSASFGYKGGNYPGTGGTCGSSLSSGSTCTIIFTFNPNSKGSYGGAWTLTYSDGTTSNSLSATFTGKTPGHMSALDSYYSPIQSIGGAPGAGFWRIMNTGLEPVTDLSITLPTGFTFTGGSFPGTHGSCGTTVAAGATCDLNVTFTPTTTAAVTVNETMTMNYHDGAQNTSSTGTITGQSWSGVVSFSASSIDFGARTAGSTTNATITMTYNSSVGSANSIQLVSPGAPYSVSSNCWTLSDLGQCTITVTYTANSTATKNLTVLYSLGNNVGLSKQIVLSGSVAP